MKKGQASIEFMFIILISIVYITTTVIPMANSSQQTVYDTANVARAGSEAQKIVNAINEIAIQGTGSKQTLTAFIPENTTILCDTKDINFETYIKQKPFPSICDIITGKCKKSYSITSTELNCLDTSIAGPVTIKIVIEKGALTTYFYRGS